MSNKSKGDYSVNKARDELREAGYWVEKAISVKFQPEDFWGCWDLIAVSPERVRFIQVSRNPLYKRGVAYKRKLKEFPCPPNTSKEYWYHVDGYFKKKFVSDGEERPKGKFFDTVKKSGVRSFTLKSKPEPTEIEPDGKMEDYEDDLPF